MIEAMNNDGGPAFPQNDAAVNRANNEAGMSLRDWFAGRAPAPSESWLSLQHSIDRQRNPHNDDYKPPLRSDLELDAEWRYRWADAMLARRAKGVDRGP